MKIYLDNNLGVANVEQEELTQDTIGYNILKVYIPNAVLTPYDTFTCYYGALLQNGRKVGWFAMEARTSTDADYEANYTLYKATLEQCVVSVEGKVYIGCQVLLGNSGNATLIKKNTAVVQFNVRKSVAINNDILVLDPDQTTTDVLESYKNLLENALTTYATKAEVYTQAQINALLLQKQNVLTFDNTPTANSTNPVTSGGVKTALDAKADKSTAITHTGNQLQDYSGNNIYPTLYDGQVTPDKTTFFDYDDSLYGATYVSTPAYNINTVFFGFATQITPPNVITKIGAYVQSTATQTLTCEIWSSYFNNVKNVIATTTKSIDVADTYVNIEFDFGGVDLSGYTNVWIAIYSTNSTPISWANLTGIASNIVNTPTTSSPNAYLTSVWNNYSNNLNFSVAIQVIKGSPKVKSTYIRSEYTMNYLYVSTTGNDTTGDGTKENPFATIYKANDSILDNSKTNRYTIIVKNGTYTDLQDRYSGAITSGPNYVGVICKDYVYYESEDILHPENCVLSWDGYYGCTGTITTNDIIRKAIFHINSGDMSDGVGSMHTHVKGFTITAKNVRYAFHVELEGRGYNTEWELSNCILNWYGRPDCSNDSGVTPVIGLGGGYFEKGIIRNCSINNLQNDNDYGIQEHDNVWSSLYTFTPSVYKGIEILIENCNLNNSNINFRSYVDNSNLTNVSKNILTIKQCINVSRLFFNTIGTATTIQWNDVIYSSDITTDSTSSYRSIQ